MSTLVNTLLEPVELIRKPTPDVSINLSHPLVPTYGIKWDEVGNTSNYKPFTFGGPIAVTASGTPGFSETEVGQAIDFASDATYLTLAPNYNEIFTSTTRATIVWAWEKTDTTFRSASAWGTDGASGNRINFNPWFSGANQDNLVFQWGPTTLVGPGGLVNGNDIIAAVVGDGVMEIWLNGTLVASNLASPTVTHATTLDFQFNNKGSTGGDVARSRFFYVYADRRLRGLEIQSLTRRPFQFFDVPNTYWFPTAAAGGDPLLSISHIRNFNKYLTGGMR